MRSPDGAARGVAGDVDYAPVADTYGDHRRADPRIAAIVHAALGDARTVLNVGAGTGSYEPTDREATAVEPSAAMRARRPRHRPAAVDARAERLPFAEGRFDAAMATFTVHQWADRRAGLAEMRRVTRGPIVLLTCDPARLRSGWLHEYAPEVIDVEAGRYPPIGELADHLGGITAVTPVPIPLDCTDGFNDAYFGRPERLLDRQARLACSSWGFVSAQVVARFEARLATDLADGTWDERHGHLRRASALEGPLVLVVAHR